MDEKGVRYEAADGVGEYTLTGDIMDDGKVKNAIRQSDSDGNN